jgi:hypothetical protein
MEIDNTKRFRVTDKEGNHIGDGVVEDILTDDFDTKYIDAYIVRLDDGDIKCCEVTKYLLETLEDEK